MFDVIIFVGEVSTLGLVYEFLALQFVSFIALLFVQGDVFFFLQLAGAWKGAKKLEVSKITSK